MTLDASVIASIKHSSDNSSLHTYDTSIEEIEKQTLPEGFGVYYEQLTETSHRLFRDIETFFSAWALFVSKLDLAHLLPFFSSECLVNQYELSSATFQEDVMETLTTELAYLDKGTPPPMSLEENVEDHTCYSAHPRSPLIIIDLQYMGKGKPPVPAELKQTIIEDE